MNRKKVQGRYPEDWWNEIEQTKVILGDFSADDFSMNVSVDAVTIISTLEHIGFDKKSVTVSGSAFEREKDKESVCFIRDENIEDKVLKNVAKTLDRDGGGLVYYPFLQGPEEISLYKTARGFGHASVSTTKKHGKR